MRYVCTIIICFSFIGCSQKRPMIDKPTIDKRLISFKDIFLSDVDSVLRLPQHLQDAIFSGKMNLAIDTVLFKNGEIYVSCISMATGCTDYTGNITYSNDTIKLGLINLSGVVCTEQDCHRFTYRISNPEDKKYVILKPTRSI